MRCGTASPIFISKLNGLSERSATTIRTRVMLAGWALIQTAAPARQSFSERLLSWVSVSENLAEEVRRRA